MLVEIDERRANIGFLVTVERVQHRANRIPDDGVQLLHLFVGQMLAVEVLHPVANDHSEVACQFLILFNRCRRVVVIHEP